MLGSHNSCSYLPCKHWWMYLINWAAKCQNKTLSQQFHAGVRYFDLRIKWDDKHREWVLAHGLVEYEGRINRVLETLNNLAKYFNEKVYVRFLLEYNKCPDDEVTKIINFKSYVDWARGYYPSITYDLIETKWDEKVVVAYSKLFDITHKYSSVLGKKRFLWVPWVYAKLHNKENKEKYVQALSSDSDRVLMLDFV